MKRLFFISLVVLIFCTVVLAQNNLPCPKIGIVGPATASAPDEPWPFKVFLSDETKNLKLEYKWTVDKGEIIEGQSTSSIKISPRRVSNQAITATVEIKGLPENCRSVFSESALSAIDLVRQEYDVKSSSEEKKELDHSIKILTGDADLIATFYLGFRNPTPKQINSRILRILNFLASRKVSLQDRITFIAVKETVDVNRIFYNFKEDENIICTNCQFIKIIKATDFDLKKPPKRFKKGKA